jgi:hypothetical protein
LGLKDKGSLLASGLFIKLCFYNIIVAMAGQNPDLFARALAKYHEITDEPLNLDFVAKLRNVDDLTAEIDARNTEFSQFREKRGNLFHAMKSALGPVQQFGDFASNAASAAFPPACLVFGAATSLIGAAKGVSASYDAIQDLMGTLAVRAFYRRRYVA